MFIFTYNAPLFYTQKKDALFSGLKTERITIIKNKTDLPTEEVDILALQGRRRGNLRNSMEAGVAVGLFMLLIWKRLWTKGPGRRKEVMNVNGESSKLVFFLLGD